MAIIHPRFDQVALTIWMASYVFNGDLSLSRNKAVIFTAVIKPELLLCSSDSARVGDVVVRKSFALSSK